MKRERLDNLEAVIFDLDGSMIDSMWIWKALDIEFLAGYGCTLPKDLQADIEGKSMYETALYYKEHFPIPESPEEIMAIWNAMAMEKYTKEAPLKEGIPGFLAECKKRGLKLGIATSNSRELVEAVLKSHDLMDTFGCILTGNEITKGKPAPDVYLAVAKRLDVHPKNCLVFEDIVAGILAGKAAGMEVCAVRDAYSEYQWKEKCALADFSCENFLFDAIG